MLSSDIVLMKVSYLTFNYLFKTRSLEFKKKIGT